MGDFVQWVLRGQRLLYVLLYVPVGFGDVVVTVMNSAGESTKMLSILGTVLCVSGCVLSAVGSLLVVTPCLLFIDWVSGTSSMSSWS